MMVMTAKVNLKKVMIALAAVAALIVALILEAFLKHHIPMASERLSCEDEEEESQG